jgi:hypothetical protein
MEKLSAQQISQYFVSDWKNMEVGTGPELGSPRPPTSAPQGTGWARSWRSLLFRRCRWRSKTSSSSPTASVSTPAVPLQYPYSTRTVRQQYHTSTPHSTPEHPNEYQTVPQEYHKSMYPRVPSRRRQALGARAARQPADGRPRGAAARARRRDRRRRGRPRAPPDVQARQRAGGWSLPPLPGYYKGVLTGYLLIPGY